jgi:ABC-type Fe3+/spermidine/putrescine transport system ATPase subunit
MADWVVVMADRRIIQQGPPAEVFAHPASVAAAALLGLRNRFEAQVLRHEPARGLSLLHWPQGETQLLAPLLDGCAEGEWVDWAIAPDDVRLPPRKAAQPQAEQASARGVISHFTPQGASAMLALRCAQALLWLRAPLRLVHALGLAPGVAVEVHLRPADILVWPRRR